jgi:PAS domain S-box-containing protein
MRFAYEPELDDAGRVVGYVAAVVNDSLRHRAEQAERLSRERFDLVVNSTEVGFWHCALPFDELVWNAKCKEQFGLSPDAHVTIETFYDRLHPEDREPTRAAIERAIAERTAYDAEYRTRQPGGGVRWIRAIGRVALDGSGQPIRFDGVTVDITSQKRAEQQLREREAYFRSTADSAPALIWVADEEGRCTYVSRRWIEYTGVAPDEALGLGWLRTVHPDDDARVRAAFLEAVARRQPFSVECRVRRADGSYRWAEDAGIPRYNEHGEYAGFIGCVFDVHERQTFAEALREADRRKDAFLATLAHELRNPLAAMRNAVQLITAPQGAPETAERAGAILARQLRQLVRLVDDLLDVSRITRNQLQLRLTRVALADVVRTAVESTALMSGSGSQRLTVTLPDEPVLLDADAERLSQVFINLLSNAIKYTPPGGAIDLTARTDGARVEVVVSDSGSGIPPDKLEEVFGMFMQVEQARDRAYGGLGIGLTLVRSLVELHGGTVAAESDGIGRGSRFVIRLPYAAAAEPAAQDRSVPAALEGGMRRVVLIADDNIDAAESLQLWLQMAGHDVHTATDGARALALAESLRPEIVLLDLGMPGLSGYDVARRIRDAPWGRGMVLIALTGWGQEEDRRQTALAGFDHHLTKPVPPDEIEELIQRV